MSDSNRGSRIVTYVFLFATASAMIAVLVVAWWSTFNIPESEAGRFAYMQLRVLRQARDSLTARLDELSYKVGVLATLPQLAAPTGMQPQDRALLDRALENLELESFMLRRYGPAGDMLLDVASGGARFPRPSEGEVKKMLEWASNPDNAHATLQEPVMTDESRSRDIIQYVAPVWTQEPGKPPVNEGVLCLWVRGVPLFRQYLERTHLLSESYSFVLAWHAGAEGADALPVLLWHFNEPQWRESQAGDATNFLRTLRQQTTVFDDGGEQWQILGLPRRDGQRRREVFACVPLVFGSQQWIFGLCTPYALATEFSAEQRTLLAALGAISFGILIVGVALLFFQRRRLELEASAQRLRELREVQHDYRELFAENPTAMLVVNDEFSLLDCNHSAERLIGVARQEAVGRRLTDFFEEEPILARWALLREQGNLHARDTLLTRRGNHAATLVEIWGRRIGDHWILMAHDVEQRRDLEQQLARLKRMDSMGALASSLAHDFNNLLGQVQILVSNLRTESPRDSEAYRDLSAIEEKVEDASELVANLMAFRETVVAREPVWLEPLLEEFAANERKLLPVNVELSLEIRRPLAPAWITPHAMRRVLSNLALNACDAMPYGGRLTIRAQTRRIEASETTLQLQPDNYVVVEVSDTGVGMSDESLDKLFQPFFTTKQEGRGAGLGLWTVFKIVRRVGGAIHVRSKLGKGSWFTIYLPSRQCVNADHPPMIEAHP